MASPSSSARKKKRARRISGGGHKSTSPTGAAAAAAGGGSEGGRSPSSSSAAVKPARTVSLEGSSSEKTGGARGKRRRPAASQDFPHSFPRLDGGVSLPPPSRRRAALDSRRNPAGGSGANEETVGVERTSLGDLRDAASGHQRREGGGGGGGGLVAASAPTMSVPASVPARRLQELFLGGDGGSTGASMSSTAPAAPAAAAVAVTTRSAGEAAVATPTHGPVGLAAAAAAAASEEDSSEGPRRRRRRRHSSSGDGVGESGTSSAAIRVPLPARRGAPPRSSSSSSSSSSSGGCGLFEELIPLGVLAVAAGGTAGAEARASPPSPRGTSSSAVPGTAALPPSAAGDVFVGTGVGEDGRSGDESPPPGEERSGGGETAGRAAGKRSAARGDARREGGSAVGEGDTVRGRGDALDGAAEAPGGTARRGRGTAADGNGSVCDRSEGASSGVLQETPSPQLLCVLETPPGSLPEALQPAPSPPPRPFAKPGASRSWPPPLSSPSPPPRSTPAAEADVCAPIPETPQAPSRRSRPVAAAATTTRRRTRSARKTPPIATSNANANASAGPPESIPETQGSPPRVAPKAGRGGQGRAAQSPRGCSADRAVAEAPAAATRCGDGRARQAADETSAGAVSVPDTQLSPQAPLRPSLAGTPSPPTTRNSPGRGSDPVASTGRSGAEPEGTPQSGGRPAVPESQQPFPEEQGTVAPRRGEGRTTLIRRALVGRDEKHPGAVGGAIKESPPPPPPLPPGGGGGTEAAHRSDRGSPSRSARVARAATGIAPEAAVAAAVVALTRKGAAEEQGSCLLGPAPAAAVRDEAALHAKTESSPGPRPPPPTTDAETSVAVAAKASSSALADVSGSAAVPPTLWAGLGKGTSEGEGSDRESGDGKEQQQQQQQQQQRVRVRKPPPSGDPPSKGSKDPGGSAATPPRDDREADGSGAHAVNDVPPPAPPRRAPSPTTPRRDGLPEEARRLEGRSRAASQPGSSSSSSGTGAAATETSTACPVGGATPPSAGVVGLGNDSGERPGAGGGDDGIEVEQTVAGDTRAAALGPGSAAACAQGVLVDQAIACAGGVRAAGEGAVTPARPRRPPAQRLDGNNASTAENGGASEDDGDGYAVADEPCPSEGASQTPSSSGAGFDYFPTGYSQATDSEQADRRGVTAADMLSFQRSLCEELPAKATTTIAAPTKPAPSPPQQPPSAKKESLPSPPPSSRSPPVTGWVPNPYETGVGSMLTPRRKRREPKALPASPFAIAADAAARRVEAAAKRKAAAAAAAATKAATTSSDRTSAAAARGVAGEASPNASRPFGSSRQHASSAGGGAAAPSPSPASGHQQPTKPGGGFGSRDPRAAQSAGPSAAGKPPNPPSHRQDQRKPNSLDQRGALKSPGPESPRCPPTTGDAASGNVTGGLGAPSDLVPIVVQAGGSGFQTARGRQLSVSAEALAKVSHIFKEPLAGGEGAADGDSSGGPRSAVSSGRGAREMLHGDLGGVAAGGTPVVDGGAAAVGSAGGGELGKHESSSTNGAETAAAPSEPTRDVGFRTARGRPVAVSAEALVRVEHLFREEEGSSLAGGRHAAAESFSGGTSPVAAKGPDRRGGTTKLSPSGRGTGMAVSSCNVADDSSGGSGGGPSAKVEGEAGWPPAVAAAAAGSSSFQTAQGRPLAVSAEALAKVAHMFAEQQPDGGGNKGGASVVVAAAAGSGSASVHPGSSLSATPTTGRDVARLKGNTSPAGGNNAAAGVASSSSGGLTGGNDGGSDGGGGGGGSGCSGFQTGRGRPLAVSAEALAKVQHLFQGNDGGGGGGGGGGAMESEARAGLRTSRPPATGGGGFQTGRGRALAVSAEALAKVQHLFQGNDDGGGGGGGGAMESPATGLRASRPPAAGARRHHQATPRSGGKPFRRPSAVRKPRARGDTDGIPGPVAPAPGLRGQAATSEASPTKASAGVGAGEGVIVAVPPAASAGKGRSTASSGSGGGGSTTTVRAGIGGGGLDGGGGVVGVSEEEKEAKAPTPATNGSGASDGGGPEKPRGSVETLAEAVDDDDAGEASAGENEAGSFTDSTTTTTPQTSGRQPQTTTKRSTDVDSLRDEGPAAADSRGAAEAPAPPTAAASGFITGGGRPVHVSAEALLKAKRLLADASGDDIEAAAGVERGDQEGAAAARQDAPLGLYQSTTKRAGAQGLAILTSGIDTSDARQGGDDWNGSGGRDAKPPAVGRGNGDGGGGSAGGFLTGSGKRVEVSPEALERARQMFAECEAATPSGAGGRGGDENPPPAIGGSGGGGGIGGSGLGGVVGGARGPGGGGTGGGVFSTGRGKLAAAPLSLRPDGPRAPCFRLPPPLPPPWLAAVVGVGSRHHHPRGEGSSLVVLPRLPFAVAVVVAAVALLPAGLLLLPWSLAVEQAAAESVLLQPRSRSRSGECSAAATAAACTP
ncbi:unnamed protein product [Ectocarpus sp. 4 AP-2014]